MNQNQSSIIVDLHTLKSDLLSLMDEPALWGLDGTGLSHEKGFAVGAMPFIIEHAFEVEPISMQIMVIINIKALLKLVGYPDKSRLLSQYVTRFKPEDKEHPIEIQVHAASKRSIYFTDSAEPEKALKNQVEVKAHLIFQLLYHVNFPVFLETLKAHLYHERGMCLSQIIDEIEENEAAWENRDGIPSLRMESSGEWMVHWRYINNTWKREFFHEVPINTDRFSRYQGEPISHILDRLIGVPIDKLAKDSAHMVQIRQSLVEHKLNATF